MAFCSSWIYLWMVIVLFGNISADPVSSPHYNIQHSQISFDHAMEACSPGVLTTLATKQEVAEILHLISKSSPLNQKEFTFWVGLRKVKNECVVPTLPLRGFKWTEDGSQESQVSRWTEEPKHTCTTVRCAALKGELNGSMVTSWGLIPVTCKNTYQFICKLTGGPPKPAAPEPSKPAAPEPSKPAAPEPSKPEPRPATGKPEPSTLKPEPSTPGTDLKPVRQGPDSGPGSGHALGLDSCQNPVIPRARSLTPDSNNSSRIQVECWSGIQLQLLCSGRPAVWRMLDDSPANFTTICQPCENGFQKNASGNCVDIDECRTSASCRHTCLNTEGSFRCVCSDESGKQHDADSPVCKDMLKNDDNNLLSGNLIWVLVAVAVLVVLVVIVAVTVKCCLMRRSKKAEKMAMKSKDGKDSSETAKEKLAI